MAEGASPADAPDPRQPSCAVTGAVVGVAGGVGLIVLGKALERPYGLLGPGNTLSGLGGFLAFGGLFLGWLAGMSQLLLAERGSLLREAANAAIVLVLPCLVLLLFTEEVHLPRGLAVVPGRWIDPELAAFGTITFVAWLAVFGWRVRRAAPGAGEP